MSQMGGPESFEAVAEADLYNEMLDVQLTVHGFTATVAQLGPFCLKGNVAEMDPESRNNWLVDQINATGATIPAHVEDTVAAITAARGLEHNYNVAAPTVEPSLPQDKVTAEMSDESRAPSYATPLQSRSPEERSYTGLHIEMLSLEESIILHEQALQEVVAPSPYAETLPVAPAAAANEEPELPHAFPASTAEMLSASDVIAPSLRTAQEMPAIQLEDIPENAIQIMYEHTNDTVSVIELPTPVSFDDDIAKEAIQVPIVSNPALSWEDPALNVEVSESEILQLPTDEQPASSTVLFEVINTPPVNILNRVTEALAIIARSHEVQLEPVARVIEDIAARLQDMSGEERLALAPTMQEFMGALHGLQVLIENGEPAEIIEAVRSKAETICARLLDELGIRYEHADILMLIDALQGQAFIIALQMVPDIEKIGTHEMKLFRQTVQDTVAQAEDGLHMLLGKLALLPHFKPLMVR
ncbi:MAG TPA: hypothetical protein VGE30_00770 [Candidatus Saccharimonadales bacterium]